MIPGGETWFHSSIGSFQWKLYDLVFLMESKKLAISQIAVGISILYALYSTGSVGLFVDMGYIYMNLLLFMESSLQVRK